MSGMYEIAAASMRHDLARLERVGMNLANLATPGYKRETVVAAPLGGPVAPGAAGPGDGTRVTGAGRASRANGAAGPGSFAARVEAGLTDAAARTRVLSNPRPGTLRVTNQAFDLALAGPGYFEVQTEAGPAYTRMGNFRLDATGRLVTAGGQPLMGNGGPIRLAGPGARIDGAGRVFQGDQIGQGVATGPAGSGRRDGERLVDQIRVMQFDRPADLQRLGHGLLGATAAAGMPRPVPATDLALRQGMLENSDVDNAQEMIELTRATRHFETVQRSLQLYDELLGATLRKITE